MGKPDPLEEFLPVYEFVEQHQTVVGAPPRRVYELSKTLDLGESRTVRWLFRLRGIPHPQAALTLDGLEQLGFVRLTERQDELLVFGLAGRFWTFSGDIQRLGAAGFRAFQQPGYAKAVWGFTLEPTDAGDTRLSTETRIHCTDSKSRKRFRRYWRVVAPFSAYIRRELLRLIKRRAEAQSGV